MPTTARFCYGCNEKFAAVGDDDRCPQCGQRVSELDAPTQQFDDLAARGTHVADAVSDSESADSLLHTQLGNYHIESFLGKGGMASVYRAKHLTLERPCAIKLLNPQLVTQNHQYVELFLSEARAAASLVHPHVVTIHTIGHDRGWHYIEMEYVVGRSLQRFAETNAPLHPMQAARFMMEICSALAEAHRVGMVHRDIKPGNVLVTAAEVAKLADFGLAKRVVSADSGRQPIVGTPYYMAPELFEGEQASARSDIYAMGVTFYFLLCGQLPFMEPSIASLAMRHATAQIPDVCALRGDVPSEAAALINRCLAKRASDRYEDADALLEDLRTLYRGLRPIEKLVSEAIKGLDVELRQDHGRFAIKLRLGDGRSQSVFIETCRAKVITDQLVKIFSVCGPAHESHFRRALELNANVPHGALGIEQMDGAWHFVMTNSYPRNTCDPEEIRDSVLALARYADEVERWLESGDRF